MKDAGAEDQNGPIEHHRGGTAFVEAGRGAPVLLLHGVGLNKAVWAPQIAALAPVARVIACDMPGHGASERLRGTPDLDAYLDWLADFAAPFGALHVVGHSMGTLLALGLALQHPELVTSVVAMNGVYCRTAEARAAVRRRAAALSEHPTGLDRRAPLARWFPEGDNSGNSPWHDQVGDWLEAADPAGYAAAYQIFADSDRAYEGRLRQLRCPVLYLTGELDGNSTPEMSRRMAADTPRGAVTIIPGARHMTGLSDAEAVNAAILGFFGFGGRDQAGNPAT